MFNALRAKRMKTEIVLPSVVIVQWVPTALRELPCAISAYQVRSTTTSLLPHRATNALLAQLGTTILSMAVHVTHAGQARLMWISIVFLRVVLAKLARSALLLAQSVRAAQKGN